MMRLSVLILMAWTGAAYLHAQDEAQPEVAANASEAKQKYLRQQIDDLSNDSYRARELARWRLEQSPLASIQAIDATIRTLDHNAAAQLVDLLSAMAMHSEIAISLKARELLGELAGETSSIGRLASNTLDAIADLQEEKAIEVLSFHGAHIGIQLFPINGRAQPENSMLSLRIDEEFDGSDDVIQWIRYLKSVESVYLLGPQIDTRYYQAIAQLTQLKAIKLKRVSMTRADLKLFSNLLALEHLGLNYVEVDDSYLPEILELPVSQSMRLYGTKITQAGEDQLNKQLDGIEIYRGDGGFLGVSTGVNSTVVNQVSPGSGADLAGLRMGDRLTHVDNVAIANFDDLRRELGKHVAGDQVELQLKRQVNALQNPRVIDMTVTATLGEDPN